jgi:ParB family chromosome partitioning protein
VKQRKKIVSVDIGRLVAHPANPNRMTTETLKKLKSHIERTGNYEPIVVRPHREGSDCFEILNGYHRVKVLKTLGYDCVDCVVWQVDDSEALMLLATLNRLSGSDDVHKKSALLRSLSQRFDTSGLSRMLSEGTGAIQRLIDFKGVGRGSYTKAFLNPVTFFLTDEQKQILEAALTAAMEPETKKTYAQRRGPALVKIARSFMKTVSCEREK